MSKNKQSKDNRTIMERLEAMGLKFASKDDPMYKLGPSIRFISRKPKIIKKEETYVSPAARKMADEGNVDLNTVRGSGKNGVILKEDIISLMGSKPAPAERKIKYGPEERVKMTRLRITIAKRLKEAQENAAMLTTFNEVDMSEVMTMRNQYKEEFQNEYL